MIESESMNPKDESLDPKDLVSKGYDRNAETYLSWAIKTRTEERSLYASLLMEKLAAGSRLLELGCGAGLPTTKVLSEHFEVTGVDLSARHIEMARVNVPAATFLQADMTRLDFSPESFDAVAAFYSIIHVPRDEQPELLRNISSWLRSGGLFASAMGTKSTEGKVEKDWLGAPMYWSNFDSAMNKRMVEEVGLRILRARFETAEEFGAPVTFQWIVAEKPGAADGSWGEA
jgi:SAM-dependent methyltransferase